MSAVAKYLTRYGWIDGGYGPGPQSAMGTHLGAKTMTRAWTQADFEKALTRPLTAKERRFAASEYRKGHREPLETITRRRVAQIARERDVLRCICEYLTVEGIPWFRMNAGEAEAPAVPAAMRGLDMREVRRIRLAPAGTADLLAIVPAGRGFRWAAHLRRLGDKSEPMTVESLFAVPFWIEVKRPGSKARRSPEQIAFAEYMLSIGCLHVWAQDVEDVMAVVPPKIRSLANQNPPRFVAIQGKR